MRKFIRDQIVVLLATLWEEIKGVKPENPQVAEAFLHGCLEAMDAVEDSLRAGLSKERFAFYAEILENARSVLRAKFSGVADKNVPGAQKALKRKLKLLRKELLSESEVCLEIVFMPYNASMWDCMESIWLAAKEDPHCHCCVVPIPYYDKNPNGSYSQIYYEGMSLPETIPVVSYENYDIQTHRPDIVYIHNIYDSYNIVTSVDPQFYTAEIKNHAGMLVYIPYYVTRGGISDVQCSLPAIANVDKIIVQSKSHRDAYAKYWPLKKLLALGSPKFDKVFGMDQNRPAMPVEWEKIAKGRKLVLYNTRLLSLTRYGKAFLDKLKDVFAYFETRNDVVLLWRPHPLSESTSKAMKPELLEAYRGLEKDFRERRMGIFDSSADMHLAIALSDAYFGDSSSLVSLFGITGKPMLLQKYDRPVQPSLSFEDIVIDGSRAWFSAAEFNGLFELNIETGKTKLLGMFPGEAPDARRLYAQAARWQDKLVFTPCNARAVAEYDLRTGELTRYELPLPEEITDTFFYYSTLYKHWLFLLPIKCPFMIRLDLRTGETCIIENWAGQDTKTLLDKASLLNQFMLLGQSIVINQNIFYAPCLGYNGVLKFNMDSCTGELIRVDAFNDPCGTICHDGATFWMLPRGYGSPVVQWDEDNNVFREYNNWPDEYNRYAKWFCYCIFHEGALWCFPGGNVATLIRFDTNTGEMREIAVPGWEDRHYKWVMFVKEMDDGFAFMDSLGRFYKMSYSGEISLSYRTLYGDRGGAGQNLSRICDGRLGNHQNFMFVESKQVALSMFLDYVGSEPPRDMEQQNAFKLLAENTDGTCGVKIHDAICGLCQ